MSIGYYFIDKSFIYLFLALQPSAIALKLAYEKISE